MIRETYRAESIARERAIAHFINGVSGQSLVNAVIVESGIHPKVDSGTCPTYQGLLRRGQFVVAMAGAAYDAQVERLARNSPSGGVH